MVVWNAPSVRQIKFRWRQPDGGEVQGTDDVNGGISIADDEGISGVTQSGDANVHALMGGDDGGVGLAVDGFIAVSECLGLEGKVVAVEVSSAEVVDDAAIGQGIGGGKLGTVADHFQVTMKLGRSLAVDFIEDDLGGGDASMLTQPRLSQRPKMMDVARAVGVALQEQDLRYRRVRWQVLR
nr:hypothetical protein [Xylella fastidiosa]